VFAYADVVQHKKQ